MQNSFLNIDFFEQFFDEKTLKKGLSVFQKSEILSVEKIPGGEFIFSFKELVLKLKKRANKINFYECSCNKIKCEHICAALFYLSEEKLQLKKTRKLKKSSSKNYETIFNTLCNKLKVLKKKQIKFSAEQSLRVVQIFEEKNLKVDRLILNLVVVNEFCETFFYSKNLNSASERNSLHVAISTCLKYLKKNLSDLQKEILVLTVKRILSNNRKFNSGVFTRLLPYAILQLKTPVEFKEFKILLHKRKLKHAYPQYLNIHTIAHHQVQMKESEFLSLHIKNEDGSTEFSVAKAELLFTEKKIASAFKNFILDNQKIQKALPYNYNSYLDYVIDKSNEYGMEEIEAEFLKTNILYDPVISEVKWKRLKELFVSDKEKNLFLDALINKFKKQADLYFEKLAMILESEKMYDELIAEINKHNTKFFLVNRIVIKKLPAYDDFTFKVYVKQFDNILYEARESFHQTDIYERLKLYLDKLPAKAAHKLSLILLEKVSRNNFIYEALKNYSEKFSDTNLPAGK